MIANRPYLNTQKIKNILSIILICLPSWLLAQSNNYNLVGRISKLKDPAKIYLRYPKDKGYQLDSNEVQSGLFWFTGQLAEPVQAQLILDRHQNGYAKTGNSAYNGISRGKVFGMTFST